MLLGVVGCLIYPYRIGLGKWLIGAGIGTAYLFSLGPVAQVLNSSLQHYEALSQPVIAEPASAAIVVLAGGITDNAPEYGGDSVNLRTLGRLRYAARLAKQSDLPVLVSGGYKHEASASRNHDSQTEAEYMRQVLQQEFGVEQVWLEKDSRNTWENARQSAVLLQSRQRDRVILVTNAAHMPRAVEAFRRNGLHVLPAPTLFFPTLSKTTLSWDFWLPSVQSMYEIHYTLHEWLGRLWYYFRYY